MRAKPRALPLAKLGMRLRIKKSWKPFFPSWKAAFLWWRRSKGLG